MFKLHDKNSKIFCDKNLTKQVSSFVVSKTLSFNIIKGEVKKIQSICIVTMLVTCKRTMFIVSLRDTQFILTAKLMQNSIFHLDAAKSVILSKLVILFCVILQSTAYK